MKPSLRPVTLDNGIVSGVDVVPKSGIEAIMMRDFVLPSRLRGALCCLFSMFLATVALGQPAVAQPIPAVEPAAPPPPGLDNPFREPVIPAPAEGDRTPRNQPRTTRRIVEAPASDKPLPPDHIRLYLMDGSVIAGRLSMKEIAVETSFGNLNVPVGKIKSITPGLVSHPLLAKEISGLIADLGSANYNDREKAQQALLKMGPPVRSELERHSNDSDVERRNRIKAILGEFDQQTDDLDEEVESTSSLRERDTIDTSEFTIVGKIVPQSFVVTSLYGDLNVKLADIRKGERGSDKKEDTRQTFSVDASHLALKSALNTGIRVERGDVVTVTADGTITMTPWGNQAVATPEGAQNYGWFIPGQIASGALVGKIGNDTFRKLGTRSTFTAERSGVLQLAIGMQADYSENQFPGKYTVKVRVQRKQAD
jgi:hypothetical protein